MHKIPLIARFLKHLDEERNFSAHTIRSYAADFSQFCQFLITYAGAAKEGVLSADKLSAIDSLPTTTIEQRLLSITPTEVRAFLVMMRNSRYSKATVARKLASLRSFYKYLVRKGKLQTSPVSVIRTPRQDKRLPKCLDISQVNSLMEAPDTSTILGARDKAILETIYSSGLRVSETVALNIEDLDEFSQALRIRGKGKKERIVPLGKKALEAIDAYLAKRHSGHRHRRNLRGCFHRDGSIGGGCDLCVCDRVPDLPRGRVQENARPFR